MTTRIRGTAAERAFAAFAALTEAEKAEYSTIARTVAKFGKVTGAPEKRVGRPPGSKSRKADATAMPTPPAESGPRNAALELETKQ